MIDFTDSKTVTTAKVLAVILTIQGVINWLYWSDLNNAKDRLAVLERRPSSMCRCQPLAKVETAEEKPEAKQEPKVEAPEVKPPEPRTQQPQPQNNRRGKKFRTTEEAE